MPAVGNDDVAELRAEQERILAMPGRVASVKLARLHRTAKIFRGNAKALLEHLKGMDDLDQMLATTSDQQAFEEFLDEAERHLHNHVAAAQSRVDHLRRFKRKDMPEGLREVSARALGGDPGLRHHGMPVQAGCVCAFRGRHRRSRT